MKVKYFATGVIVALMVIFSTGADKTELKTTQWEYAEYTSSLYGYTWKSPYKDVFKKDKAEFVNSVGVKVSSDKYDNIDLLNHAGNDGWELISVVTGSNTGVYHYFKRPKQ